MKTESGTTTDEAATKRAAAIETKRAAAQAAAAERRKASALRLELKGKVKAARDHAQAISNTANAAENYAATQAVEQLQRELADHITDGALPCPFCDKQPIGMEHPQARGSTFEIGCMTPTCVPFEHTDGTKREVRVRGGTDPSHAVDSWNEGPDAWCLYVDRAAKPPPTVQAALPPEEPEEVV